MHAWPRPWVAFEVISFLTLLYPPPPPPQGSGGEIVAVENRYEIINSTRSLVVHNSNQQNETLYFYCTAENKFGRSVSNNFTVEFLAVAVGKCAM